MTRVSKWGNSLALRLPASVVESLSLKEGDEISVTSSTDRTVVIAHDDRREAAIRAIRGLAKPMPPGFKFDRQEASRRGLGD